MTTLDRARRILRKRWGHLDFRSPQDRIVAEALADRDVLAVLPTGFGKSVCFQLPAVIRSGTTLVVSPLISLIHDQVAGARSRGIEAFGWTSGTSGSEVAAAFEAAAKGSLDLLYVSPERLEQPGSIAALARLPVEALAVDEAHCVSEWGHEFRPAYLRIASARVSLGDPPATALTATATARTRRDIERLLGLREPVRVLVGGDRPNLHWSVVSVPHIGAAVARIRGEIVREAGATIVYAGTRGRSARLAIALSRHGLRAAAYHAGLGPERRSWTQDRFLDGSLRVICATSAFGMGIDHPHVRLVLHLGAPGSIEAYVQEAGRAGRDGESSRCRLVTWGERRRSAAATEPRAVRRAEAMHAYLRDTGCRRAALAVYFGERPPPCSGCDNCDARALRTGSRRSCGPGTSSLRRRSSR